MSISNLNNLSQNRLSAKEVDVHTLSIGQISANSVATDNLTVGTETTYTPTPIQYLSWNAGSLLISASGTGAFSGVVPTVRYASYTRLNNEVTLSGYLEFPNTSATNFASRFGGCQLSDYPFRTSVNPATNFIPGTASIDGEVVGAAADCFHGVCSAVTYNPFNGFILVNCYRVPETAPVTQVLTVHSMQFQIVYKLL
jgi:hypothetical protein